VSVAARNSGLDEVVGLLRQILQQLRAPRSLSVIEEAALRFEQELPLLKVHVAALLGVSETTVDRQLRPAGGTARGKRWYSHEQVKKCLEGRNEFPVTASLSRPARIQTSKRSRSSTARATPIVAGTSTSNREAARESDARSVQEIVQRLRPQPSTTSSRGPESKSLSTAMRSR
jgi:hypothetical protein